MQRQIEFRAFVDLKKFKVMIDEVTLGIDTTICGCHIDQFKEEIEKMGWVINYDDELVNNSGESISLYDAGAHPSFEDDYIWFDNCVIMQFTGKKSIKEIDLYDGDIVFIEEAVDEGDKRYYLVIVWIPEWCMFASLHTDEYEKFLKGGAKELDETMYWTYMLESSEKDFHYAGNIYSNPELLEL